VSCIDLITERRTSGRGEALRIATAHYAPRRSHSLTVCLTRFRRRHSKHYLGCIRGNRHEKPPWVWTRMVDMPRERVSMRVGEDGWATIRSKQQQRRQVCTLISESGTLQPGPLILAREYNLRLMAVESGKVRLKQYCTACFIISISSLIGIHSTEPLLV
jgi:hypothetical protein